MYLLDFITFDNMIDKIIIHNESIDITINSSVNFFHHYVFV